MSVWCWVLAHRMEPFNQLKFASLTGCVDGKVPLCGRRVYRGTRTDEKARDSKVPMTQCEVQRLAAPLSFVLLRIHLGAYLD